MITKRQRGRAGMKYKAIIETDDYKNFEFFEDGNGKYIHGIDAGAVNNEWIALYFTECGQEPCNTCGYEEGSIYCKEHCPHEAKIDQEPCEMTAEEYRQRMIQAFHNADTDELIAICVLPTEKEFKHLEWLLKNHYKKEPCGDAIDRSKAIMIASGYCHPANVAKELAKLPAVNPQLCEDAISRQAVIDSLHSKFADGFDSDRWWNSMSVLYAINKVPPVNPIKTGHWIRQDNTKEPLYGWYFCSECNSVIGDKTKFCSNCGAKMVEPQESEDKQ